MEQTFKLLVNAPSGGQLVEEVEASGSYFDPTLVLWDERVDGPLPDVTLGAMERVELEDSVELRVNDTMHAAHTASVLAADRAARWEAIKAERDRRSAGGVNVGGKWFHTDSASRIQHLGLKDSGRDLLAAGGAMGDSISLGGQAIMWKTMDGSFVAMTTQLAFNVVGAVKMLDALAFMRAEALRGVVYASDTPNAVDITTGWPAIYGG